MRHSIEPRDRRYVKDCGFLSFAKNIGKNITNKYSQKLVNSAKKSATDAMKTASKRGIQKTQKQLQIKLVLKFLIRLKVFQKKSSIELPSRKLHSDEANNEIPKERYISPQER